MTRHTDHPETNRTPLLIYTLYLYFGIPLLFIPIYLTWDPYQPFVDGYHSAFVYSYMMGTPFLPPLPNSFIACLPAYIEGLLLFSSCVALLCNLSAKIERTDSTDDATATTNTASDTKTAELANEYATSDMSISEFEAQVEEVLRIEEFPELDDPADSQSGSTDDETLDNNMHVLGDE